MKTMGILYRASQMKKNMKHQMVIDRLIELEVRETQSGKSIFDLTYDELKSELVLAEMRQVDIDCPSHKWFR